MAHMTPEEFIDFTAIYPQNKVMGRSREAGFTDELHYSREDLYRLLSAYHDYTLEQVMGDVEEYYSKDKSSGEIPVFLKRSILQHKFNK